MASASAAALIAAAAPAWAQDQAADSQSSGIEDIVVTATRQATNMQDTPLAITAVASETLNERGLKSTADLSQAVPNATFRRVQGAFGPGVSAFIRGIGQADTSLGSEPSVAYYVDDVYYPLLLGSNFDLLDLDHIEVLRGPQGTLFGRNALAGAVNIVSKAPSLTETSAYVQATLGSYNRMDIRAGFNVPLTSNLGLSVSGVSKKRDGYQRMLDFRCDMERKGTPALAGNLPYASAINTTSNNFKADDCTVGRLGGEDVRAVRGSLRWEPVDNVSLTLIGDYTRDRSENPADQLMVVTSPGGNNLQAQANYFGVRYDSRFVTGDPFTTYATYTDPVGAGVAIPAYAAGAAYAGSPATPASTFHNGRSNRGGAAFSPVTRLDNWGVSGKLVVGLTESIDLTAIAGFRKMTEDHSFDIDGSPLVLEHTLLNIGEEYKNFEVRLSGKSDLIDWVAGGFYFEGDGFTHAITYSPQSAFYKIQNIKYDPLSKAVFANVTVKPMEGLGITLGGRYSDDKKSVDFSNVLDTNPVLDLTKGDTAFKIQPAATRFDWKIGVDYRFSQELMVYASAATGARLPGYNARPQQPTQVVSFGSDETLAYELGFKADLWDRKLRLNVAAFYTDYKSRYTGVTGAETNILSGAPQAGTCVLVPFAAGGAGATSCRATPFDPATETRNLANGVGVLSIPRTYYVNTPGKVKGFEVEMEVRPIEGLAINGAIGFAKFDSPDLKIATRANDRLAGLPEWNGTLGIQYRIEAEPLGGSITPRLDWFYTGNIAMSAARNTYNQPAYSLFNGRLSYANDEHQVTVSLGVSNLFDKRYYHNFFVYQDIGFPNVNGQPGAPRQWFVELGKKF
ncbi:MAG: TonB-dependent receptor [Sphingomonadales bacterium]|nr:TonB-dependent receptor [Sphingomonadales bacterium]